MTNLSQKYRQMLKGFYYENALDKDNSPNNVNSVHNTSSQKYRHRTIFDMKIKTILELKNS